jgi:molybdopterin synthase sulfur carrier subunit
MIKILYFATIRDYTKEKESSIDSVSSIREMLVLLSSRYGASFKAEVLEGDNISDRIIVLVNGKHIAHTGGQDTTLKEGDTVAIFPIIGGG